MATTLTNPDLAPTAAAQRTWSMWHVAALWVGMSVCIPTYMLAAGMIEQGMSWWQAVLTVMLGNLIVLVPMILNGHAGTKYGVPFPVLARASFGTVGAQLPSIARALVACGWFGIQTWIGGAAIYQILGALGWIDISSDVHRLPILGTTATQFLCFIAFWLVHVALILFGIGSIKWVESWAAPFLLACGVALLAWAVARVDNLAVLFPPARFTRPGEFWTVFFPQLTAMVGFWATLSLNIPDFTRYCRSQRDQALGQLLGLPTTMTLFCMIGILVTSATVALFGKAIWDPVELAGRIGATPGVVVVALVAILIATLSTNIAANVVSPANGFSNLWPQRIGFRGGALITCALGVVMMPWYLLESLSAYLFTWLIGYSALLGPIAGVMLCDYFVLRRTRLDERALYDAHGPYRGVNWAAIAAVAIALLPNLPGFVNAATGVRHFGPVFDSIYGYAWFLGVGIAALIYYLLMRGRPLRAGETA